MQAGLGKRTLSMSEDMSHSEVIYPSLAQPLIKQLSLFVTQN